MYKFIDYIKKNQRWLFSGIGVLIISLILAIVAFFIKPIFTEEPNEQKELPQTNAISNIDKKDWEPSPYDISKKILAQPPLQRNSFLKNYIGISVSWDLSFQSAMYRNEILRISFRYKPSLVLVICDVPSNKYPQFKLMHESEKLHVNGVISKIEAYDVIWLEDVEILF